MAIYHLEGKVISRSQGRSAVAASAYRACERLVDERTGLTHDFTRKSPDLVAAEILLPASADSRLADRHTLWNAVETHERRKDAQLCREFNIALPRELSEAENWDLAKEFVQQAFVDKGMIADMAYHRGHKSQEGQPHIHVMLTMRSIDGDTFGQKVREWNDKALLLEWREQWAETCNRRFLRLGIDLRIDHRTLEAQGIRLEPQSKLGPTAAKARLARLAEHQAIARANGERLLADPQIVFDSLHQQQSTFTQRDIARVVNRNTADREQFAQVMSTVMASEPLMKLATDDRGTVRYTTRTHFELERQLVRDAVTLAGQANHVVSRFIVERVAERAELHGEHLAAFRYLMGESDVRNLVGVAGAGKSCLLDAVRQAHEQCGHRVMGLTLAGKAAEGLEDSAGIKSRTVASQIMAWDNGRDALTADDVIVIDEAAMLDSKSYGRIVAEARAVGAKLIPAFDTEQLQAIGAGAPARAVAERTGFAELTVARRQQVAWQQSASQHFAVGETQHGLTAYAEHDAIHGYRTKAAAIDGMLARWEVRQSEHPQQTQLMLAYENKDVHALNTQARERLQAAGHLSTGQVVSTARGQREFAPGDRVYFLQNDYRKLDVKNGTLGTVEQLRGNEITVRIDATSRKAERSVTFNLSDYNHLDYGYAATVHKSQGATVDWAHYLPSPYTDRHATYSALTRHRQGAEVHYGRDVFASFDDLVQSLSRENTKDFTLDYIESQGLEANDAYRLRPEPMTAERQPSADQLRAAEERILARHFVREANHQLDNLGFTLSDDALQAGDSGIYRSVLSIENQRYGVLDMGERQAKLVPYAIMESRKPGRVMQIEAVDERTLRAFQPQLKERTRERELGGFDLGGFER